MSNVNVVDRESAVDTGAAFDASVRYCGRSWKARISPVSPTEALLETELRTGIGSLPLCYVEGPGGPDARLVLACAVTRVMAPPGGGEGRSSYLVGWRWAYAEIDGPSLRRFLERKLGVSAEEGNLDPVRIQGGAYVALDANFTREAASAVRRVFEMEASVRSEPQRNVLDFERMRRPLLRLRRSARVPVDMPCRCVYEGSETSGWLADLSRAGAFVTSRWRLPALGERTVVVFTPCLHGRPRSVVLMGEVVRTVEKTSGHLRRGFALKVERVVDDERGAVFNAFLDRTLESQLGGEEEDCGMSDTAAG